MEIMSGFSRFAGRVVLFPANKMFFIKLFPTDKKIVALRKKICYTTLAIAFWPYRLAVRTAPSHGTNSGSSPDRVTKKNEQPLWLFVLFGCSH